MKLRGFLDKTKRRSRDAPLDPEIQRGEKTVSMQASAYIMLRAIMSQQRCKTTVVVPRRDGVPPNSIRSQSYAVRLLQICRLEPDAA